MLRFTHAVIATCVVVLIFLVLPAQAKPSMVGNSSASTQGLVTRPGTSVAPTTPTTTTTTTTITPNRPRAYRLANGLQVILQRDDSQPFVAVRMTYLSGSASDPLRRPGLAHLTEHMAFGRTRHISRDLMLEARSMGALEFNGETSLDTTVYYETIPNNRLEQALWLESERMAFVLERMTPTLLRKEQRIIERELAMRRGPMLFFESQRRRWLYPKTHPYHQARIEDQDPHASSLDDVRAYFQATHRSDNAILSLVGDFEESVALALVEKYFAAVVSPPVPIIRAQFPNVGPPAKARRLVGIRASQPIVGLDWVLPKIRDLKTLTAYQLLQWYLDGVMEYRLLEKTRIASHLVTGLHSGSGPATLRVTIFSPARTDATVVEARAITAANEGLKSFPLALKSKRELSLFLQEAHADLQWKAAEFSSQLANYGRPTSLSERLQILKQLTAADLEPLVTHHLTKKRLRTLLFLPGGDTREGNVIE